MNPFFLQCITMDGIELSHTDQVTQLCEAGAKWIQLRMKSAGPRGVERTVDKILPVCRDHGVLLIINDHFQVALETGAGGVHLGKTDFPWAEARSIAGPEMVIGGTVNSLEDARAALASRSLDYVGVGPFRQTKTKEKLAPVLEEAYLEEIVEFLGDLPKVVIGGVIPGDLPVIAHLGADGVAVSSGLLNGRTLAANLKAYLNAWPVDANGPTCRKPISV